MRYPERLKKGNKIGVCAPSSGVTGVFSLRLDNAIKQLTDFHVIETDSVRNNKKLVSASKEKRAKEFMSLYINPEIRAIIPPWGGELLMDILPFLDYKVFENSKPKWVCGYSDTSTLLFVLTVKFDIATIHSPNLLEFGANHICESDYNLFNLLTKNEPFIQNNLKKYQKKWSNPKSNPYCSYNLTEEVKWKLVEGDSCKFTGRLIGGCMDTICKLFGTPFAPISDFIEKYKVDGIIWYMEFLEMDTTDIYRTLLQMKYSGFFNYTNGILIGRSENEIIQDFHFIDAIALLNDLNVPIIYDVDFGHMPPQLSFVNGAIGEVTYQNQVGQIIQMFDKD